MERVTLPGTDLAVSPLCLGGVPFGNTIDEQATFALLDRFVELGGNFVDTARVYSDWVPGERRRSERILGDWLRARGCRDRMIIGTKGAHPILEFPDAPRSSVAEIRDDLEGSLRTLGLDAVGLYWLHRDDSTRPVEHFVDLLNVFRREGKLHAWGVSNWTAARLDAAWHYARVSSQTGPVATSHFGAWGASRPGRRRSAGW